MPLRPHDSLRHAARRAVALAVCSSMLAGAAPSVAFAQSTATSVDQAQPAPLSNGLVPSTVVTTTTTAAPMAPTPMAAPVMAAPTTGSSLAHARTSEADGQQALRFSFSGVMPQPKVFELVAPRRLVLDFSGAQMDSEPARSPLALSGIGAQSVQFATGNGKTRVVVVLREDVQWAQAIDGADFVLKLTPRPSMADAGLAKAIPPQAPAATASGIGSPLSNPTGNGAVSLPVSGSTPATTGGATAGAMPLSDTAKKGGYTNDVVALDYKKGTNAGSGRLVVDFSQANPNVDIKEVKGGLRMDLLGTASAPWLLRQYDLSDLMTPVSNMDIQQLPDRVRIFLRAPGTWAQSNFQLNRRVIVDFNPVFDSTISAASSSAPQYKGQKLTLAFQDAPVRQLLAVLADFSGFNIIAADGVDGNLTLNLKDVPWDQALDVILKAKGLDKRQSGNVVWVDRAENIQRQEASEAAFSAAQETTQALVTESFQINYQKAEAVQQLLADPKQPILSKRGSAVFDGRTNQLFVQDIPTKIEAARALIKKVDIPVRQVLIEAQIVEANDTFSKALGAKFGVNGSGGIGNGNKATIGGGLATTAQKSGQTTFSSANPTTFEQSLGVNLPVTPADGAGPGLFSMVLSNASATRFLNLELEALVSDGQGQILSNPRLVTADQQEATIQQGTQIPYLQASSAGNTDVTFKDAELSLKVKPQITPDGNVIMTLDVHKDTVGQNTTNGPSIDTKSINTQVLVESGGTVIIGGIYVQTESLALDKVPFLGDLPVIGNLFKTHTNSRTRTELLVMITPKVVNSTVGGSSVGDDMTSDVGNQPIRPYLIDQSTLRQASHGQAPKSILPEFGGKPDKELQYSTPAD